ncbi:MAG: energy transducer TonB [Bacteroidia bacterium]|nr:energy transducer TonB [Bacteroidia bacterium]
MSKFFILLIIAIPFLLTAKETKKIVRQRPYPAFSETYYVLKSDTNVRHGSYKAEVAGKVILSGFYTMGKPDSIWTQYNVKGKIRARGWFNDSKRDSIWEFCNHKGELEQKIDFTHNQVLYYQTPFAQHPFRIISKTDTIMSILNRPPLFIGGMSRFNDYVAEEMHIPLHKPGEKVNGTVYIAFTVDSLGRTSNQRILKGIGKACNEEALRVMRTIPDEWIPGILNDKFVTVDYIVLFPFDARTPTIDPFVPPPTGFTNHGYGTGEFYY